MNKITNQGIAGFAMFMAVVITFAAFVLSRADHDLKLMSLTAVISLGSGLLGIAGTLLVGLPAYHALTTGDLPGGSTLSQTATSSLQLPPEPENPNLQTPPSQVAS